MKLFAKLLLTALVLALLLPFTILKDDKGSTLMSFSDFKLPDFSMPDLPDAGSINPSIDGLGGKDIFYKWYDADGNVQFTTEPPPDGIEYTIKGYDPNTNVIQAVKLPEEKHEAEAKSSSQNKTGSAAEVGTPYSQESIKKLFEDAKNIEQQLNQRTQNQESAINQ